MNYFKNSVIAKNEAILRIRRLLHSFFDSNVIKKKNLFAIIIIITSLSGFAQKSNKKRVLVVPYGRFDFVSEFSLEDIAEKNETTAANVFLIYQKSLLTTFEKYQDENFEFVAVDPTSINSYKKFIKYKPGKFNGKNYNAVYLKEFKEEDFKKFLENQNTDFVIFITWYDIHKEAFTRGGRHDKRVAYAAHYLDYDIYNLFKQRIVGMGKVKAEANVPNDLEASFKLLRVKEIESGYNNFISKVIEQLNKPIEN